MTVVFMIPTKTANTNKCHRTKYLKWCLLQQTVTENSAIGPENNNNKIENNNNKKDNDTKNNNIVPMITYPVTQLIKVA